MPCARSAVLLALVSCLLISQYPTTGRLLKKCDAASELRRSKVVDKSFVAHLVCVMKHESNFNTSLIKGPGTKASYSYGVFQISSDKWCSRYRVGGECKKKCDSFADDDIQDDIVCADLIFRKEGLKHWPGWVKYCKNGQLPSLSDCKSKSGGDDDNSDNGNIDGNSNDDVNEDTDESLEDSEEEYEKEGASENKNSEETEKIVEDVMELLQLQSNIEKLSHPKLNVGKLKHPKQMTKDIRDPLGYIEEP